MNAVWMNFRLKLIIDLGFFFVCVWVFDSFKYFKIIIIIVSYYVLNSNVKLFREKENKRRTRRNVD